MHEFYVYKTFETINGFFFYVISVMNDEEVVIEQVEHTSANKPDLPMYKYLNETVGWDNVDIEKATNVKPIDVINNQYANDEKIC